MKKVLIVLTLLTLLVLTSCTDLKEDNNKSIFISGVELDGWNECPSSKIITSNKIIDNTTYILAVDCGCYNYKWNCSQELLILNSQ
jgi:hypothetical protein